MNFLQAAAAASSLFIFLVWQRYTKNNLNVNVEQYILQEADFPYFMDRPQFFFFFKNICGLSHLLNKLRFYDL